MTNLRIKRGDTFEALCQAVGDHVVTANSGTDYITENVEFDITAWTIRCEVRDASDVLVENLIVTKTEPLRGFYKLTATNTKVWPLGTLYTDIEYTDAAGKVISTETWTITVSKDITL